MGVPPSGRAASSRSISDPIERSAAADRQYRVIGTNTVPIVDIVDLPGGSGDVRARLFETLVDRRALDRAYRTARLILGNPIEAEDATHDAALAAWRRFADLREPERFEAWFGRILVNACRDRLRARRRLPISVDALGVGPMRDSRSTDPADAVVRESSFDARSAR